MRSIVENENRNDRKETSIFCVLVRVCEASSHPSSSCKGTGRFPVQGLGFGQSAKAANGALPAPTLRLWWPALPCGIPHKPAEARRPADFRY